MGNSSMVEADAGSWRMDFTVSLSKPHTLPVTFDWKTVAGTATANQDFRMTGNSERIMPGKTTKTFRVVVYGDTKHEAVERFTVRISNPKGASISKPTGTGTIVDDD
jgi:hypothetical protein